MRHLHREFPHYNWKRNKGYGTEEHRNAIDQHGLCKYHRKSFDISSKQYCLFDVCVESDVLEDRVAADADADS